MTRRVEPFDAGWRFHRGDIPIGNTWWGWTKTGVCTQGGSGANLDDTGWREVTLPHDFVIEGDFSSEPEPPRLNPDGSPMIADLLSAERFSMWDAGDFRLNRGALPQAVGWYRKHFRLPEGCRGKRLYLTFDGVFRSSRVFLNQYFVGDHPSGFTGFTCDITDFADCDGENLLALRCDSTEPEGWYYEGGGIYRHVRLTAADPLHLAPHGIQVRADGGRLRIEATLRNYRAEGLAAEVRCRIVAPDGTTAAEAARTVAPDYWCDSSCELAAEVAGPRRWSLEDPALYRCVVSVLVAGEVVDESEVSFGIRTMAFDADRGFLLNGRPVKIRGMCCHQDHAGVGAAVPDAVQEYRLRRLMAMGCNAYRSAHHPPSPELAALCDRLGMLLLPETRLMSTAPEHVAQLRDMVLAFRNHPSVMLWGLGNEEFRVQTFGDGPGMLTSLRHTVRRLDDRPVTAALVSNYRDPAPSGVDRMVPSGAALDVAGFNYCDMHWLEYRRRMPRQPFLVTEESSCAPARGCYRRDDLAGHLSWLGTDQAFEFARRWRLVRDHDFIAGIFIWTGFDYRGEPAPMGYPAVASSFGVLDSCGFAKDNFYYYASQWRDEPLVHLFPHWTWPGRDGALFTLYVFSNCGEVELLVNGISAGRRPVVPGVPLEWPAVVYAPGAVEAVGYNGGREAARHRVETAGAPAALRLETAFAGSDAAVIAVRVVDDRGRVVPYADNRIEFTLAGAGRFLGAGNGDPASHEPDPEPVRRAFNGLCQVIVRPEGTLTVTARSAGLTAAALTLEKGT